jgi:hypothetical protein
MWAWLAIPWVRKLGEVLLLILALVAVVHFIYHRGVQAGAQGEAGRQVETNRVQFEQIRTSLQQQLDEGRARETELKQMAMHYADLAVQANAAGQAARQAAVVDAGKVHALPDTAIKADLEVKLGGPLENPAILRKADEVVTDYPHQIEIANACALEVKAMTSGLETCKAQTVNARSERDAALSAYNQLVPIYAQAYNAAIQGHRKWYCLWLCKKKSILNLPAPASLVAPKSPAR